MEEQKKLDVPSDEVLVNAPVSSGRICVLVSEEDEEASFADRKHRGKCVKNFHYICSAHKLDMVEQFYFCCF